MRSIIPTRTPMALGWQVGGLVAAGLVASLLYALTKRRAGKRRQRPQGLADVDGLCLTYAEPAAGGHAALHRVQARP